MALFAWLQRLLGGFMLIDGARIGKVIWLAVWIILALTVYHKVFIAKTNTNIIQHPQQVIIQNESQNKDLAFVGIKIWWIKLGLTVGKK